MWGQRHRRLCDHPAPFASRSFPDESQVLARAAGSGGSGDPGIDGPADAPVSLRVCEGRANVVSRGARGPRSDAAGRRHATAELLVMEPFDLPQDEIALRVQECVERLGLGRCDWPLGDYAARSFLYAV